MHLPKRPRFRFGLRTLFVVVTVVGTLLGWFGYQLNWIRQRQAAFASGKLLSPTFCMNSMHDEPSLHAPWPLNLFGAEPAGVPEFWLPVDTSDDELARIRRLFPEAKAIKSPPLPPWPEE